ncbi:hypothetical protein [Aureicoccus marinus]|uniref:hypothetical protein n=1 Tax=Aureicoccus marinus TaxID=754435 RepID=UPI0015E41252|nr:hypothetical protein [Aureicoccus marinus]
MAGNQPTMNREGLLFLTLSLCFAFSVRGQIKVTQKLAIDRFLAEIELTSNGISPIPAFSLGEPA